MAILIVSRCADFHAYAALWAFEKLGVEAAYWIPASPLPHSGSAYLSVCEQECIFDVEGRVLKKADIDAVWMRRWPDPVFPAHFDENDRAECTNQLVSLYRGTLASLPSTMLWANPLAAGFMAENHKLKQLVEARQVGFSIPDTLATDDVDRAKDFLRSLGTDPAVYKPFVPSGYRREGKSFGTPTTLVSEADLDCPEQLRWAPGIFQRFVPKAFELRVSVFGRNLIAAKIQNQDPVDWRIRQADLQVEPFTLPDAVAERTLALMERLGLTMGMIDMIVTPDGDYVFLEINEQGQFLWVEQICPDIPMLATFIGFIAGRPAPKRNREHPEITCDCFAASSTYERFKQEQRRATPHVPSV